MREARQDERAPAAGSKALVEPCSSSPGHGVSSLALLASLAEESTTWEGSSAHRLVTQQHELRGTRGAPQLSPPSLESFDCHGGEGIGKPSTPSHSLARLGVQYDSHLPRISSSLSAQTTPSQPSPEQRAYSPDTVQSLCYACSWLRLSLFAVVERVEEGGREGTSRRTNSNFSALSGLGLLPPPRTQLVSCLQARTSTRSANSQDAQVEQTQEGSRCRFRRECWFFRSGGWRSWERRRRWDGSAQRA